MTQDMFAVTEYREADKTDTHDTAHICLPYKLQARQCANV